MGAGAWSLEPGAWHPQAGTVGQRATCHTILDQTGRLRRLYLPRQRVRVLDLSCGRVVVRCTMCDVRECRKQHQKKKSSTGLEPAISRFVGGCLIHWATKTPQGHQHPQHTKSQSHDKHTKHQKQHTTQNTHTTQPLPHNTTQSTPCHHGRIRYRPLTWHLTAPPHSAPRV